MMHICTMHIHMPLDNDAYVHDEYIGYAACVYDAAEIL